MRGKHLQTHLLLEYGCWLGACHSMFFELRRISSVHSVRANFDVDAA